MDYAELFGSGDVDGSGDMPTAAETAEWIRQVKVVLEPQPDPRMPSPTMEYSRWLVVEHEKWLEQARTRQAAA